MSNSSSDTPVTAPGHPYTEPKPPSSSSSGTDTERKAEEAVLAPVRRRPSSVGSALARHESVADAQSLAGIDRPPSAEEGVPPARVYHPLSPAVLALLMPASVLGVLARLGLLALVSYDGEAIFPLAYVQGAGCFVMGFALAFKEPIGWFYGPLYTAITTGFCGSLTTFSSWEVDVFNSWTNSAMTPHWPLRNAVDGIGKTVFTFSIALSSVSLGAHIATLVGPHIPTPRPLPRAARHTLTLLGVLVYAATLPAYFRLPASYRHQATAALLFSVPGTLARYLLSLALNARWRALPLGTLAANMLGTALLGAVRALQGRAVPRGAHACALLQGVGDGFCGCLTTVSTFAAEVGTLRDGRAWFYAVLSWGMGQLLLLIILGSSYWAGHAEEHVTCVYS